MTYNARSSGGPRRDIILVLQVRSPLRRAADSTTTHPRAAMSACGTHIPCSFSSTSRPLLLKTTACDRSTAQKLWRLLSTLRARRHVDLGGWLGFRRPVPLMPHLPEATAPNVAAVEDDLAAGQRPRHARALAPRRKDKVASRRGAPTAYGPVLPPVGPLPLSPTALVARRLGPRLECALAL
jgi:hypothetical protein